MVNEIKIDKYRILYETIVKHLKNPNQKIDWTILERHKNFLEAIKIKSYSDNDFNIVEKDFYTFLDSVTKQSLEQIHAFYAQFNPKINLKSEKITHLLDNTTLLVIAKEILADYLILNKERKRLLLNTYESLKIMQIAVSNFGLLMNEINKRDFIHLFSFILTEKSNKKSKTIPHYYISEETLYQYVKNFNHGQSMRINGKFVAFKNENDVKIVATRLKNMEEVNLYKQLKHLSSDTAFLKSEICKDITSNLISPLAHAPQIAAKSIDALVKEGETKKALELALKKDNLTQEDKNGLILLLSRFSTLEKEREKGFITPDQFKTDCTQITHSFIQIIEALER